MASFAEVGKEVFREYIRSAIIIDDQWPENSFENKELDVPEKMDADEDHEPNFDADEVHEPDVDDADLAGTAASPRRILNGDGDSKDSTDYDGKFLNDLQRALLRKGVLTCGFRYQQTDREIAVNLARSADIIVLDWDLVHDNGAAALDILGELGGPLRFICILTGQGRAEEIRDKVKTTLGDEEQQISAGQGADFRLGSFVFAIRMKEGLSQSSELTVDPNHFFEEAIGGLVKSFGGLVQLAMLEMTYRHREHLPKILKDFEGHSIDTAVLLETGDKNSPVDSGGAFLNILVDEWRSRLGLEQMPLKTLTQKSRQAFGAMIWNSREDSWPDNMKAALVHLGTKSKLAGACSAKVGDDLEDWFASGCENDFPEVNNVSPKIAAWAAVQSVAKSEDLFIPFLQLDALFHQQLNSTACLTQGTVVRVGGRETYLVCTTPLCDTDRPSKVGYLFTFARTRIVPKKEILRGGDTTSYCVIKDGRDYLCLAILIKERISLEIRNRDFDDNGAVHAQLSLGGLPEQQENPTKSGVTLHQVAQLRLDHALALSAESAADASRVGVNRVELIRSRVARPLSKKKIPQQ